MRPTRRPLRHRFLKLGPVRLMLASFLLGVGVLLTTFLLREHWRTSSLVPVLFHYDERSPVQFAEIFRPGDNTPIASTFLPSQEPLYVPEGGYLLRVGRSGRLSRTSRFSVGRGRPEEIWIPELDGALWETSLMAGRPPDARSNLAFLPVKRGHDLLAFDVAKEELIRLDGRTGAVLWKRPAPILKSGEGVPEKPDVASPVPTLMRVADKRPMWRPIVTDDLDGDGEADTLWIDPRGIRVIAVAGAKGQILWDTSAIDAESRSHVIPADVQNSMRSQSLAVPDLDGDGIRDLAITFSYSDTQATTGVTPCGVEALSGKTGKRIWTHLPSLPPMEGRPQVFIQLARRAGRQVLALTVHDRVEWCSLKDGTIAFPATPLGSPAYASPIIEDPDGDGNDDVVAFTTPAPRTYRLSAIATDTGTTAWNYPLDGSTDDSEFWRPRLVDIDRDRIPEILIPPAPSGDRPEMILLDGRNGQVRWKQPVAFSPDDEVYGQQSDAAFALDFDINQDGFHDIVRARMCYPKLGPGSGRQLLEVEGISGIDGKVIWLSRSPAERGTSLSSLKTWGIGADGKPLIVVSRSRSQGRLVSGKPPETTLIRATTGAIDSTLRRFQAIDAVDLDGDAQSELLGVDDGTTAAIQFSPPLLCRYLGTITVVDDDRNRDGLKDVTSDAGPWDYPGFPFPILGALASLSPAPPADRADLPTQFIRNDSPSEGDGPAAKAEPEDPLRDGARPREIRTWSSVNGRRTLALSGDGVARDPSSDRPLWRAVGPLVDLSTAQLLVPNADWKAPILIESDGIVTVARPMIPFTDDPELEPSWDRSGPVPVDRDPRAVFALPWWIHPTELEVSGEILVVTAQISLVMIGLPYLILTVTRRHARSAILRLMSWIAAVAIAIGAYRMRGERPEVDLYLLSISIFSRFIPDPIFQWLDTGSPKDFWRILIGLPVVGLLGLLGRVLIRRQYLRFAAMVGGIVGLSAIIGAIWLAFDPLPPGGWRAWDGWWILPAGVAYAVGLAAIPVGIVASAVRVFRRLGPDRQSA